MNAYRFGYLLCLLLVSLAGAGCVPGGVEDTAVSPQTVEVADDGNRLIDAAGRIQVELPDGWEEAPAKSLHDSADLYAKHPSQELYLVVVGEPAADVAAGTKDLVAHRYRQIITDALDGYESSEKTDVEQISGYPAIQYEIRGTLGDNDLVYLHTTVFVGERYYQVVAWTSAQRYGDHQAELQQIIRSFNQV